MDTLDDHRGPPLTVVLGDISDLGSNGGNKYRRLIRRAATSADEVILTAGSASRGFKVLDEGFTNIVLAPTLTDVADQLARSRSRVVLLKSNTSAHLERVVESVGIVLPPHP
jgi:UDP-N-acetylmuramyl pentapeptide synthase